MTVLDISRAKALDVMAVIRHLGLEGSIEGREFVARNPTRTDERPGSFSIRLTDGKWGDFATGDRGDLVDLWRYVRGLASPGEAALQMLRELEGLADRAPAGDRQPVDAWTIISPAVGHPRPRGIRHPELGVPYHIYDYRTIDGDHFIGFVCRWDLPDGKQIRPCFLFRSQAETFTWRWSGPKGRDPRPLFGLHQLGYRGVKRPNEVWIVEGEKTALAAQPFAPENVAVLSWMGGVAAAPYVDVQPLRGIPCVLIPDRDAKRDDTGKLLPYAKQPSMQAMQTIAKKIQDLGCEVSIVDYTPTDDRDGWDLADAAEEGWDANQVQEMVRSNRRSLASVAKPKGEPPAGFGAIALWQVLGMHVLTCRGMKNQALATWETFAQMFHAYGITCRLNEMSNAVEMHHAPSNRSFMREEVSSLCLINGVSKDGIDDGISVVANQHRYHPAIEWITSRPWDGESRVANVFSTVKLGDCDAELSFKLFYRWCMSAIALAFQERRDSNGDLPSAQGSIVLVGGQGVFKSRWVKSLAPAGLVMNGYSFNANIKDCIMEATSRWIVELSEFSTDRQSMAATKAFITRSSDKYRKPYAREAVDVPRRTVYIATVNHDAFLMDETGSRRWWTMRVVGLDASHQIDMQQFWAEMLAYYRRGDQWWLTTDEHEKLNSSNQKHQHVDVVQELLTSMLDWESETGYRWMTVSALMSLIGQKKLSPTEHLQALAALRREGCRERKYGHRAIEFLVPRFRNLSNP